MRGHHLQDSIHHERNKNTRAHRLNEAGRHKPTEDGRSPPRKRPRRGEPQCGKQKPPSAEPAVQRGRGTHRNYRNQHESGHQPLGRHRVNGELGHDGHEGHIHQILIEPRKVAAG